MDSSGYPLITYRRHCCSDSVTVASPPGFTIGTIDRPDRCQPIYTVHNAFARPLYRIAGPSFFSALCCPNTVEFHVSNMRNNNKVISQRIRIFSLPFLQKQIYDTNDEKVGRISQNWPDLRPDCCGIQFPPVCDTQTKALLLGAFFLIVCIIALHEHLLF